MDEVALARHGESEASAQGVVGGDTPLTAVGREQARALGEWLRHHLPIEVCFSSGARRARETAELAVGDRGVRVTILPELGEIGFGAYEGRSLADYRAWVECHSPTAAPPGGESRVSTLERFARGFRSILARPERHALVVGHGLTVRSVLDAHPRPIVADAPYGRAVRLTRSELEQAVERLERWCEAPTW